MEPNLGVVAHAAEDLRVEELPEPTPAADEAVLEVAFGGICGSDLHARVHGDVAADIGEKVGYDNFMRPAQRVVMGHEFVGEVVSYGLKCRKRWNQSFATTRSPVING